jgi:hypothetical protein
MAITISGNGITSSEIADGTILNADINASAAIAGSKVDGSFGKVLQVLSTFKSDAFDTVSTTNVDVTGLSVNITPASTSNKILVMTTLNLSGSGHTSADIVRRVGGTDTLPFIGDTGLSAQRRITIGDSAPDQYHLMTTTATFLDAPATTSQITYTIMGKVVESGYYFTLNRTYYNANYAHYPRGASSITVMEIEV